MFIIEFFLIFSIILVVYNYIGYPVLIYLLAKSKKDRHIDLINASDKLPNVTVLIAAYNEESVISKKLDNSLNLDYPREKLQVVVVSDGSDDSTPNIVEGYSSRGVVSLYQPQRMGKSAAINRGVEISTGDIILLSDANNDFNPSAVKELVKHFTDPEVGAVTGAKHIYRSGDRESSIGDGLYWKYEAFIKKSESTLGSITAAEGEMLAVRKSLLNPIDPKKINDDAAITFDLVKSGYRVLYEENARSEEEASKELIDDINVKIRMTAGGFQTVSMESDFLFPPTSWFSAAFISHKLLRWLTPHFLVLIFLCNWLLLDESIYQVLLFLQVVFYGISIYGWINRSNASLPTYVYVPMYFSVMNMALFKGFLSYTKGLQTVKWKKAKR